MSPDNGRKPPPDPSRLSAWLKRRIQFTVSSTRAGAHCCLSLRERQTDHTKASPSFLSVTRSRGSRRSVLLAQAPRFGGSLHAAAISGLSLGHQLAQHRLLEPFQVGPEGARAGVEDADLEVGRQSFGEDIA